MAGLSEQRRLAVMARRHVGSRSFDDAAAISAAPIATWMGEVKAAIAQLDCDILG